MPCISVQIVQICAASPRRRFRSQRGGPVIGWAAELQSREEARVPYADRGEARIWYTVQGTGFPVLTLAPGGMRSSVPLWEMAAISPLTAYAGQSSA